MGVTTEILRMACTYKIFVESAMSYQSHYKVKHREPCQRKASANNSASIKIRKQHLHNQTIARLS